MSTAAAEAFQFLNAGIRKHYRGWGDTASAARDRAAREAGITAAQAERVWKRGRSMASVDGDVYRGLRNTYGHLCTWIEGAADAMERNRLGKAGTRHAVDESTVPPGARDRAVGDRKEG